MKTSNKDFLREIIKKALEMANSVDTGESKLVWPNFHASNRGSNPHWDIL